VRRELWAISNKSPGTYPLVFVDNAFAGDMDGIQTMIDNGSFGATFEAYVK
jgi:glutaredoxin-related protein|tara:strand:+ start:1555 stop:1707 length:153 start_codon:yes stop_codon:yes gene_type:complete